MKVRNWIKNVFSPRKIIAWCGVLSLIGVIFAVESCKTYAYSVDTNGNLVSDNLFDITDFFSEYDTRYSLYTDNYYRVSLKQIMFTNHYDLKIDNHNNISFSGYIKDLDTRNVRIRVYDNEGTTIYNTIGQTDSNGYFQTAPLDNVYSIGLDWSAMGDCLIKDLMFNYGTAKSYEPYGQKYYSFQNYNENYQNGYTDGLNAYTQTEDMFNSASIRRSLDSTTSQDLIFSNVAVNDMLSINRLNQYIIEPIPSGQVYQQLVYGVIDFGTKYKASDLNFTYSYKGLGECYINFGLYDINTNAYVNEVGFTLTNLSANVGTISISSLVAKNFGESLDFKNLYLGYMRFNSRSRFSDSVDVFFTFNMGYTNGYNVGYNKGKNEGYDNGYYKGYDLGYYDGYSEAVEVQAGENSLYNMVLAIADVPVNLFKSVFDFNILGINISQFVMSIVSLLIVVWLIKRLI